MDFDLHFKIFVVMPPGHIEAEMKSLRILDLLLKKQKSINSKVIIQLILVELPTEHAGSPIYLLNLDYIDMN